MYKISIVVPVYNTEAHLPRCLDSIAAQSLESIECIIVNDHSPGNCDEIVRRYRDKLNIHYLRHDENKGTMITRIDGAKAATGDYIGYLDSDDYAHRHMYRVLYEKAVAEKADIVHCHSFEISPKGKKIWQEGMPKIREASGDEVFKYFLNFDIVWGVWDKIFSRDILQKAVDILPQSRLLLNDDLVIFFSAAFYSRKYISINDALYYYSRNDHSITASDHQKLFYETIATCNAIFTLVERLGCFGQFKNSVFFTYGVLYWLFHSINELEDPQDYLEYLCENLNVDKALLFRLLIKWETEITGLKDRPIEIPKQIEKALQNRVAFRISRLRADGNRLKTLLKTSIWKIKSSLKGLILRISGRSG